jgi:hypothetical protein
MRLDSRSSTNPGWWERARERRRERRQLRAWRRERRKGSIDPTTSLRGVNTVPGGPPGDSANHGAAGVTGM